MSLVLKRASASAKLLWSGLPFSPLGNVPDPGIKPESLSSPALAGGFSTTVPPGSPKRSRRGVTPVFFDTSHRTFILLDSY